MSGNRPIHWMANWLCSWKLILHYFIFMLTVMIILDYSVGKYLCEKTKILINREENIIMQAKQNNQRQGQINDEINTNNNIIGGKKVHSLMIDLLETAGVQHDDDDDARFNKLASNKRSIINSKRGKIEELAKRPVISNDENHNITIDSMENSNTENRKVLVPRLPKAIIIGARKCGTRALLKFLELNPRVKVAQNEIHFFDKNAQYSKGLDWYRRQMPVSDVHDVTIEKSPAYFITSAVPQRMKQMNSTIKLILIVRDPVTRLISDYTQVLSNKMLLSEDQQPLNGSDSQSFERYITRPDGGINVYLRSIKTGMYAIYLEHWRKFFDPKQMLIVDGERLIRSPYEELKRVEQFLGLPSMIQRDNFIYNATKGFYCIRRTLLDGQNLSSTLLSDMDKNNEIVNSSQSAPMNNRSNSTFSNHKRSSLSSTKCLSPSKGRKHIKVDEKLLKKLRQLYYPFNEYLYSMIGHKFDWPE